MLSNKPIIKSILHVLPWLITFAALYYAFQGINWSETFEHLKSCNPSFILIAILLTFLSYWLRSIRWRYFFPNKNISQSNSFKVLILGFFMNNVLPARTGELVRAHLGAKVTKEKRTLVLATIAGERLSDGLVISVIFLLLVNGSRLTSVSSALYWVAALFFVATLSVFLIVLFKNKIFSLLETINSRIKNNFLSYGLNRVSIFIDGIAPLVSLHRLPKLWGLSVIVWLTELGVYLVIIKAYGIDVSLELGALFLVAVNFSSLIPSAPGGIGVIEAIASNVLINSGIARELAVPMVVTQHLIQYLMVGIPGIIVMLTWKKEIAEIKGDRTD